MHETDAQVIAEEAEVRNAIVWICYADRQVDNLNALPNQTYGNFRIGLHAGADSSATYQATSACEWVYAKAAHCVLNGITHAVDVNPPVGQTPGVQAKGWNRFIVDGVSADK